MAGNRLLTSHISRALKLQGLIISNQPLSALISLFEKRERLSRIYFIEKNAKSLGLPVFFAMLGETTLKIERKDKHKLYPSLGHLGNCYQQEPVRISIRL